MLFYFCDCNLYRSFYQRASGPAVNRGKLPINPGKQDLPVPVLQPAYGLCQPVALQKVQQLAVPLPVPEDKIRSFYQRASGPAVHRETWNKDWRRKDERKTYRFRAEPLCSLSGSCRREYAEKILGAEIPAARQGKSSL